MAKIITQKEADRLFSMEKVKVDDTVWALPYGGTKISIPLQSKDFKEKFMLDVNTSKLCLAKLTLQNRTRDTITLCRLDIGVPHRNPDGQEVGSPHIHLYREGFDDKWAYPLPNEVFKNIDNKWDILVAFMTYCNITDVPNFNGKLLYEERTNG